MADRKDDDAVFGLGRCEAVAAEMIHVFADWLAREAEKTGGRVEAADLAALAERFVTRDNPDCLRLLQSSADACARIIERRVWERARRQLFERLLVKRFAHLLPSPGRAADGPRMISRQAIPGLMTALSKMIGEERYKEAQTRTTRIAEAYRAEDAAEFPWDEFYADDEAQLLLDDIQMQALDYLDDLGKRLPWMTTVINNNLAAPSENAPEPDWRMTETACWGLLAALYGGLAARLKTDAHDLEERYGAEKTEALRRFLERLHKRRTERPAAASLAPGHEDRGPP